ncbi:hypothetical protein LTS10_013074 [Elasticomyces elasticus]|nr:hypothetical protein LTS10_013074 [Elasticomyces elasticus]
MVAEITDFYIKQRRTVCLAVIQATDDYANQPVLTKVRQVDVESNRTLGIITKPGRLPAGSGTEEAFIALARNEDVFFKLGWHVVKNRKFEESQFSNEERNGSEARFFRTSNFQVLPTDCSEIEFTNQNFTSLIKVPPSLLTVLRASITMFIESSGCGGDSAGRRFAPTTLHPDNRHTPRRLCQVPSGSLFGPERSGLS